MGFINLGSTGRAAAGYTRNGWEPWLPPPLKALTEQLKELEEDGIVRREAFAEVPPRVEYSLTAHGRALLPILEQLSAWHCAAAAVPAEAPGPGQE